MIVEIRQPVLGLTALAANSGTHAAPAFPTMSFSSGGAAEDPAAARGAPAGHLPRVEITLPRVTRDLLMLAPSFSLVPEVDAASARSLPARSTRWILLRVL